MWSAATAQALMFKRWWMLQTVLLWYAIRNIRGTRVAGYRGGILATISRNASTVVHAAIQHVSSQAWMKVAKANTNVVTEIEMVATLGSKTSPLCRSMDKRCQR